MANCHFDASPVLQLKSTASPRPLHQSIGEFHRECTTSWPGCKQKPGVSSDDSPHGTPAGVWSDGFDLARDASHGAATVQAASKRPRRLTIADCGFRIGLAMPRGVAFVLVRFFEANRVFHSTRAENWLRFASFFSFRQLGGGLARGYRPAAMGSTRAWSMALRRLARRWLRERGSGMGRPRLME